MLLNTGIITAYYYIYLLSTITGSQDVDCYIPNAMKISPGKNEKHNNLHDFEWTFNEFIDILKTMDEYICSHYNAYYLLFEYRIFALINI